MPVIRVASAITVGGADKADIMAIYAPVYHDFNVQKYSHNAHAYH